MNKIYIIILLSLISKIGNSQQLEFNIENKHLSDFIKVENRLNSKRIPNESTYSKNSVLNFISFLRKENNIPNLVIEYEFIKKDSLVTRTLYEWDVSRFEKELNNKKGAKFRKKLSEKFLCLEKRISKDFGKPIQEGILNKKTEINDKDKYHKTDKWMPNDSTEIKMTIFMSNHYEKKGMITTATTHKIRLSVKSKKKIVKPKLNNQKINELDLISRNFLKTLEQKNFKKSETYFSEIILNQVNEKIMNELTKYIDFKKELELIYNGIQIGMDGKSYTMLNYKYENDKENPPMTLIKVVFDNNDKIVGFKPMTRGKKLN